MEQYKIHNKGRQELSILVNGKPEKRYIISEGKDFFIVSKTKNFHPNTLERIEKKS